MEGDVRDKIHAHRHKPHEIGIEEEKKNERQTLSFPLLFNSGMMDFLRSLTRGNIIR